jgi:hypothetical protein|tara:strand:+ start:294 stop:656 length:363 start_codon:yes stop_codon:yes gene_type:complete
MGILGSCLSLFLSLTAHTGLDGNYNNIHPHVQCEQNGYIRGMYYNSESELSVYLGKQFKKGEWTIDTVLVTGYESSAIQPMIRFKKNNWYFSPTYESLHNKNYNLGLVIGYEWSIKHDRK